VAPLLSAERPEKGEGAVVCTFFFCMTSGPSSPAGPASQRYEGKRWGTRSGAPSDFNRIVLIPNLKSSDFI
jgi:hypothetical protein